ncbi:hypothetical protein ACWERY_05510 [Streptomyces sp. NPDC004082]|uniref:hypothetical protein n=1 Tax=unclassified Streptomyces TaxID=2593676 RepID=UPI0033B82E87
MRPPHPQVGRGERARLARRLGLGQQAIGQRPVVTDGARDPLGGDERERGDRRAAPLRIDASRGDWSDIEALWLAGDLRDDDFEDLFIDEITVADIGAGADGWEFSGSSYSVELR